MVNASLCQSREDDLQPGLPGRAVEVGSQLASMELDPWPCAAICRLAPRSFRSSPPPGIPSESLVIVAEDLQRDPAGIMNALCNRIGLEHRAEALNWRPGHLEQWDNWKHWHREVAASSSIRPSQTDYAKTVDNDSRLAEYHSHHEPFYLEMRRQRLIA